MFLNQSYSIRYGLIKASSIINLCGPDRRGGGQLSEVLEKRNTKDNFYNNLEEHILTYGIINPILISFGYLVEPYKLHLPKNFNYLDINKSYFCDRHGGSRLFYAQKHNLSIPCIINWFSSEFSNLEELNSIEHILSKFIDKPEKIFYNRDGLHIVNVPQIHMEQKIEKRITKIN